MNILQKIKTNSKFRFKAIMIFVVAVLILGNVDEKKTTEAAICASHNTGSFMITSLQYSACHADGCVAQMNYHPSELGLVGETLNSLTNFLDWAFGIKNDLAKCVVLAQDGKFVMAASDSSAMSMCDSARAEVVENNLFGNDVYVCKSSPAENKCSSDMQRSIANILPIDMDCKTKFYVVAGGAGFIALILILAVI